MQRDEDFFLPLWHRYYSGLFGNENLFIVDHNSSKIPMQSANLVRVPFDTPVSCRETDQYAFDRERFRFISQFVGALLIYYDIVIYNDTDEIFLPDPAIAGNLREYLDQKEHDCRALAGVGLELFHDPAEEAAFDAGQSITTQRRHFLYRFHHSKPHILMAPCRIGGHGCASAFHLDTNLYLLHLKYLDWATTVSRQGRLHQYFGAGRGGPASRWRFAPEELESRLREVLALPRAATDFDHATWLSERLDQEEPLIVGRDRPATSSGRAQKLIQLADYLPTEQVRRRQRVRRKLPPRFAEIWI